MSIKMKTVVKISALTVSHLSLAYLLMGTQLAYKSLAKDHIRALELLDLMNNKIAEYAPEIYQDKELDTLVTNLQFNAIVEEN